MKTATYSNGMIYLLRIYETWLLNRNLTRPAYVLLFFTKVIFTLFFYLFIVNVCNPYTNMIGLVLLIQRTGNGFECPT